MNKVLNKIVRITKEHGIFAATTSAANAVYWRLLNGTAGRIMGVLYAYKSSYKRWIATNENERVTLSGLRYKPKISIIVPVYNVDPKWLNRCIESVTSQNYKDWDLCLYDDASTNPDTIDCLRKWQNSGEKRIKIRYGKKNQHISGASNSAMEMAVGEYVGLLDNDDELAPNALYEFAKALNRNKNLKYIYSDEDKINEKGKRFAPFFKPDWNPDLLLSMMYTSHFSVYKKSLVDEVGGFRKGYEGSQDYDLCLRVTEKLKPAEIYHIPKILYHWRAVSGSTATGQNAKDYTTVAALKALNNYLERNKIKGMAEPGLAPGSYRIRREILDDPKVSIIIPLKDKVDLLRQVVNSILDKTDYKNYEIVLVNNQSVEPETLGFLKSLVNNKKISVLDYIKPFNFSAINNFAVGKVKSDYVLLLNNDTEVITAEWLSAMLEEAQRPEVGAVGAKLLFADGRIQHAGVIMGLGIAGHSHKLMKDSEYGYFSQASVIRDYLAVTAACLLVARDKYLEVGGMNENDLAIAYNDVDFCLRLVEAGYRNVYTPYAKLYHYESVSRGNDNHKKLKEVDLEKYERVNAERKYMLEKWSKYIDHDPFYNQNLTRAREDFSLRTKNEKISY